MITSKVNSASCRVGFIWEDWCLSARVNFCSPSSVLGFHRASRVRQNKNRCCAGVAVIAVGHCENMRCCCR